MCIRSLLCLTVYLLLVLDVFGGLCALFCFCVTLTTVYR